MVTCHNNTSSRSRKPIRGKPETIKYGVTALPSITRPYAAKTIILPH